jgi:ABC-2 type transport system ATP-binding protein
MMLEALSSARRVDQEGSPALKYPLIAEGFGRRYRRRGRWAVRDASFRLPEGSITALVGPNGAGKSTLIRSCVGFERPDQGRLSVLSADPVRERTRAVNSVGYVPQNASLYRNLSIGDHLTLAQAARPLFDRSYALTRIRDAGLTADRQVGGLSSGEQAQVALALALATRAPLLLLDEPLASLDPLARRDFLTTFLDDVRTRGATALLSSHIVSDMEHGADRLLVLADGRVVLDESVDTARARFRVSTSPESIEHVAIGSFTGPDARRLSLIAGAGGERAASLEEIVLGHLASVRSSEGDRTDAGGR